MDYRQSWDQYAADMDAAMQRPDATTEEKATWETEKTRWNALFGGVEADSRIREAIFGDYAVFPDNYQAGPTPQRRMVSVLKGETTSIPVSLHRADPERTADGQMPVRVIVEDLNENGKADHGDRFSVSSAPLGSGSEDVFKSGLSSSVGLDLVCRGTTPYRTIIQETPAAMDERRAHGGRITGGQFPYEIMELPNGNYATSAGGSTPDGVCMDNVGPVRIDIPEGTPADTVRVTYRDPDGTSSVEQNYRTGNTTPIAPSPK